MSRSNRRAATLASDVGAAELAAMTGDTLPGTALVVANPDADNSPVVAADEVSQPVAEDVVTETVAETPAPVAAADPFADLPMVTVDEFEFRDLSGVAAGANAFKYTGVHAAALEAKAQVKVGWKHASAMLTLGSHRPELKPDTVYGSIQTIVASYGRAGVPAYVVVAKLRQKQIGNKRSKYCSELPPVGWAEGWIDTFITKSYGKVMDKKAPSLTPEAAAELNAELAGDEGQREAA